MGNERNIWYFENVDLFELFCPHKVPSMKDRHVFHYYKKDQYIYFESEPSRYLYLVANGRVKIGSYSEDGKEVVKAILSSGEIFGEMALVGETTRSDFAQALDSDTSICPMTIEDMHELMYKSRTLNLTIFKLIGLRIQKLERKVESLVFKDARTRIVEFIRDQAREKGKKVGFETMIKNYLTHKDIASLTGTSRQTVTTILNELKEKNIITFNRRRMLIRDLTLLK
ncbi:MAG: Crp/Fnr family transcriptional regulator [Candidatus Cyclobacteriaceae bacterium M3_2C_046]